MEEIAAKYRQVQKTKSKVGGAVLFSNAGKDDCEWDTLGTIQELLLRAGEVAPLYACKGEAPDFRTYLGNREMWDSFEITDVLRPGYRMHEWHKRAALSGEPILESDGVRNVIEHPWKSLRDRIAAKSRKAYPPRTCLAVYYNIGLRFFPDMDTPFYQQLLTEHAKAPFEDLSNFGRVLILDSEMKCLVQLFPSPRVIFADK